MNIFYQKHDTAIKIIITIIIILAIGGGITACCMHSASWERTVTDIKSNFGGGLDRTINVYSLDGTLMGTFTGKIDISSDGDYLKFDLDGKRYIYYNAIVEVLQN